MIKDRQRKFSFRRQTALLLTGALLAGLLPLGTVTKSRAAEQPALRNPRILKTTQEVAPGSAGKKELKKPTTENGITTWDCIWFGNYWQEDTNGDGKADKKDDKTPIKWWVLSVEGDDVFLLADKNLDRQKYNDTNTSVTWENCTMRSWLNGYGAEANKDGRDYSDNNFLDQAFLSEEQTAVKTTNVVNHDNPEFGTEGGKDTSDKVYLLSIDEVTDPVYGFNSSDDSDSTRQAVNTAYVAGGGEINSGNMGSAGSVDGWWLRSPGDSSNLASYVGSDGYVGTGGSTVNYSSNAARPALHLNLSSASSWSYAGTVTSDGKVEGPGAATPSPTPETTQKPQETVAPGKTAQPDNTEKPGAAVTPVSSDPGKAAIGKVSALKLKQKKHTVTVSWKKLTGAKGYQICYSTSKKWKGKKQKLVSKNKAVIKKLKKKKTYYFRVRAYRLEGTKKVYGAWSNMKKIKIKK